MQAWTDNSWFTVIGIMKPVSWALAGAIGAAVAIGAVAGFYPALRGARVEPTTALRTV